MEITTPGRICLFGEHQDYLGLPTIAMAISLRSSLKGEKTNDRDIIINKTDLGETESFSLDNLDYESERDYFKSGIKTCMKEGLNFSRGFNCKVTSNIPFQAGTSSSSSIMVSWIHFLSQMADEPIGWDREKIGQIAYKAEVLEFGEPGGMMDQYSTSIGNCIFIKSMPNLSINKIKSNLGTFVLGDSLEPKNTLQILKRCRNLRLDIIKKLQKRNPDISFESCDENQNFSDLNEQEKELYLGTINNREILKKAIHEFGKNKFNHEYFGQLLIEHHMVLKNILQVSTNKIDNMIQSAMSAGALGGKINGSGGGGCMFAYAPDNPKKVANAIENAGGKAYIVHSDKGTRIEGVNEF